MANTSVFIPAGVSIVTDDGLTGGGTLGSPLSVVVDGSTLAINGSNQVESTGTVPVVTTGTVLITNGGAIKTDTTTAHTALMQAYDVNGTTYRTFATLTNGDVPSFTISQPAGGILAYIPPTADPHVIGALWNNAGTLTISAG